MGDGVWFDVWECSATEDSVTTIDMTSGCGAWCALQVFRLPNWQELANEGFDRLSVRVALKVRKGDRYAIVASYYDVDALGHTFGPYALYCPTSLSRPKVYTGALP